MWRPVLEELLVPFERFECMSREEAECAAVAYLVRFSCESYHVLRLPCPWNGQQLADVLLQWEIGE